MTLQWDDDLVFERFKKYRLIGKLSPEIVNRLRSKPWNERRRLFSIGVIDDNPFEPKSNLENIGYKIQLLGDIRSVSEVAAHHIVLCDLQGVGLALDPRNQGAFLIQEIKRHYPEKYVIAYTGGAKSQAVAREAATMSDRFLKKDTDIDEWVSTLDGLINGLTDPTAVWQRQRLALASMGVDTLTILQLEDAFVKTIEARDSSATSAFETLTKSEGLASDVRAIARSVIASGLFAILTGS